MSREIISAIISALMALCAARPHVARITAYGGNLIKIEAPTPKVTVRHGGAQERVVMHCTDQCVGIYATDFRDAGGLEIIADRMAYAIAQQPLPRETRTVTVRQAAPYAAEMPAVEMQKELLRTALGRRVANPFWSNGYTRPLDGEMRQFGNVTQFRASGFDHISQHKGADISASEGTPVKAALSGIVDLVGKGYFFEGNVIVLNHGDDLHTIYAHLQDIVVRQGDLVTHGEFIGTVGSTGRASGPHLHWAAVYRGRTINPASLAILGK